MFPETQCILETFQKIISPKLQLFNSYSLITKLILILIQLYNKLACVPYERMMIQCANNYGVVGALKNMECSEINDFFQSCLNINHVMGKLKASQPEFFIENEYSREKPHFN